MKPENDRQYVAALAKGIDVLRCFTAETPALSVSEITRMTKIPQPTVWRLCHTLLEEGLLVTIPGSQVLRPGVAALGIGFAALSTLPLAELVRPDMQQLADRHAGAVSLGACDGTHMIYLQRCQGSAIILGYLRVGSRVPIASSATGWAYLAGLTDEAREAKIEEIARDNSANWKQHEKRFRRAYEKFLQTGYVENIGSLHKHINAVAVPIGSKGSAKIVALSSGGISGVFTPEILKDVGASLVAYAKEITPVLDRNPIL